jgi:hypothetical protein
MITWETIGIFSLLSMIIWLYAYNPSSGEKVKIEAHGGPIDIEGVVVAKVNDKLQVQSLDIWYDPMAMFRQISKEGQISGEGSGSGCPFVQG